MNARHEQISALIDDESDESLDALIAALEDEEGDAAKTWQAYHLIGDVMAGRPAFSSDFMASFSTRLAEEPVVLAPRALGQRHDRRVPRWAALSVAASVAIVGATSWYMGRDGQGLTTPSTILAVNSPVATPNAVGNPYLVAHQALLGNPRFSAKPVILTGAELVANSTIPVTAAGGR